MTTLSQATEAAETLRRRSKIAALAGALAAAFVLYFAGLTTAGLLGPDEPRYAAIGREMARSGDWITPRLWGKPWFEKPPLVYWTTGLAFRAGLSEDLAPRLPIALFSTAFLAFYFVALRREFGCRAAAFATAILGTTAGWIAFSRIGVTDLPMSALFSAAMLLCLGWVGRGERRALPAAAALLGAAVLAKGLVPLALALPLAWTGLKNIGRSERSVPRLRDWLRPAPLAAFLLIATPWYALMVLRHGREFLDEFFLKHHIGRVYTEALQHVQPFWFYVPVLLAGLLPWTPLLALLFRRKLYDDPRARFLLLWLVFGFIFFSVSTNKLPGYLLPLLPAACALAALALCSTGTVRWPLAAAVLLLGLIPVAAEMLPAALRRGITHTRPGPVTWPVAALVLGGALWAWKRADARRGQVVAAIVGAMTLGVLFVQVRSLPELDRRVSARPLWREIAGVAADVCVENMDRERRYGLNYYSVQPLPDCQTQPQPIRIAEAPDGTLIRSRLEKIAP